MTVAAAGPSAARLTLRVPVYMLLLGAVVGVFASLAADVGPSWAAFLAHYGAGYVLLIAVIGVLAPSPLAAAIRSVACFVCTTGPVPIADQLESCAAARVVCG